MEIITFWKDIVDIEDIEEILESNVPNYSKEQLDESRMIRKIFDIMDHIKYDPSTIPKLYIQMLSILVEY